MQGGGRSCGALRWRDGGDGGRGVRKPKSGRQRRIRSEKEGGGKKKAAQSSKQGQCN